MKERTTTRGLEVEICRDSCDLYIVNSRVGVDTLWDVALLMNSFVSDDPIDRAFAEKYSNYAIALLERRSTPKCRRLEDSKKAALCSISELAKKAGVMHVSVTYDEGNRCETFSSFDDLTKVLKESCTRVKMR